MEFKELAKSRRSVRSYRAEETVLRETVEEILRAAQMGPTWKNSQTGRYYVALTPDAVAAVRESLPEFNQKNTENASAYIVTTFRKGESGYHMGRQANTPGEEWGAYDLGLQNAYLLLAARDLGLDTLIMGLRDEERLREYFSIPEEEEIMPVISLGYRDGEPAFRPRKDLDDIAFFH